MDKQTTLAFVLIGLVLVVWLYFNQPEPVTPDKRVTDSLMVEKQKELQKLAEEKAEKEAAARAARVETDSLFSADSLKEKIITIETDLIRMEFTTLGGRMRRYFLKDYSTWYYSSLPDTVPFYKQYVQLINTSMSGGDFDLVFVTSQGKKVNTSKLPFTPSLNGYYYKISGDDSLTIDFTFNTEEFKSVTKRFKFYGNDYALKADVIFDNMQDVLSGMSYDLAWMNGINFVEENSVDEANYSKAGVYSGEEYISIDASSEGEVETKDLNGKVDWVGIRNKYFGIFIAPENPETDGGAYFRGEHTKNQAVGDREYYAAHLKIPLKNTPRQKDSFLVYIGPMKYDILGEYNRNFNAFYDFGSFMGLSFVTRPISEYVLLPLFTFLHKFIPNYGFVIIVLSIIIKIVLYPLTKKSYQSMKRMQLLQPKIAEMKKKYADDQARMQKEQMKLYSTYGVNPMGGCLPMVLQMPILFALFTFFNVTIEIRHEPFILWITNLSSPDIIYTLPFKLPLFGIDKISGLALLLGIAMFLQQKMSVKDPSQKAMVYVMPVMFTFLFMSFSSGLNLYYFMFNILSVLQQSYINKSKKDGELQPVEKKKQKKGFMQKMMENAEKQAQLQKDAQKGKKPKKRKF